MKITGRCPKCQAADVRRYPSVRSGGGPLAVGDLAADFLKVVSQFDAFVCARCGYTELYVKTG